MSIVTPEARMSYPHLLKPDTRFGEESAKFKVNLVIPKNAENDKWVEEFKTQIIELVNSQWEKRPSNLHIPQLDGDKMAEKQPEYEGNWVIKAKCNPDHPPHVFLKSDKAKKVEARDICQGDWCRAEIEPRVYTKMGNGIYILLHKVLLVRKGEPFAGQGGSGDPAAFDKYFEATESSADDMFA